MEQSTLFTTSKWDLLQVLSHGDASPIELAKQAHTSLANISQQLRLLDLAGFVKSRRIPNRDKGKPRIVYSLTDEFAFIVVASMNFVEKKFIKLSAAQKSTLRCWFYPDVALAPYLERATLQLLIAAPRAVAFDSSSQTFFVISAPGQSSKDTKVLANPPGLAERQFPVKFLKEDVYKKTRSASWYFLLDPAAPTAAPGQVEVAL